jgi:hypothetical protein
MSQQRHDRFMWGWVYKPEILKILIHSESPFMGNLKVRRQAPSQFIVPQPEAHDVSAIQFIVLECLAAVHDPKVVDELDVAWLAADGDRVLERDEVDCI